MSKTTSATSGASSPIAARDDVLDRVGAAAAAFEQDVHGAVGVDLAEGDARAVRAQAAPGRRQGVVQPLGERHRVQVVQRQQARHQRVGRQPVHHRVAAARADDRHHLLEARAVEPHQHPHELLGGVRDAGPAGLGDAVEELLDAVREPGGVQIRARHAQIVLSMPGDVIMCSGLPSPL